MLHVLRRIGCEDATIFKVALDVVLGDALANDAPAFKGHVAEQLCLLGCHAALDHIDITAVAVDDLPAITTRCAKADFCRLNDADLEAVFQQGNSGR